LGDGGIDVMTVLNTLGLAGKGHDDVPFEHAKIRFGDGVL
jgi:hypothetical protein